MPNIVARLIVSTLFLIAWAGYHALAQSNAPSPSSLFGPDTPGASQAATDLRSFGPDTDNADWRFPATRLNKSIPSWIQFGGQFRNRTESQDGLGYKNVDDVYDLTQLRLGLYIQPTKWLKLVGVTQDSRVFFNHHIAEASP